MSLNLENISVKMTDELDKAVVQKPVTGFMADNNLRGKFVGTKTVMIPEMNISGLGDYDRDTGFVSGTVSVTAKPFTLAMDRGRSFQLDREDNDESGVADLAGQIMGEFVRTQVVPEVDAYVLSKLSGYAVTASQTVTGTPATDAYKMLTQAIAKAQNAVGYDEELVAFVDGTMLSALQNSEEISRHLVMNDFKKGDLTASVTAAETKASASPFFTRFSPTTREESFLRRIAIVGASSVPITLGACTTSIRLSSY